MIAPDLLDRVDEMVLSTANDPHHTLERLTSHLAYTTSMTGLNALEVPGEHPSPLTLITTMYIAAIVGNATPLFRPAFSPDEQTFREAIANTRPIRDSLEPIVARLAKTAQKQNQ